MSDLIWYLGWFTVACISLYLINRQRKSFDAEEVTNQEPTVMDLRGSTGIKAPVLTEFQKQYLKKLKDSAERERKTFDRKVLDGDITAPKDIESKDMFLIRDEYVPNPRLNPYYKEGPIEYDWTKFKERNPELFDVSHPVAPNECFVAGTVLAGILLVELQDSKVIRFYLEGNVPPNGDYMVEGELKGTRLIHVTKFQPTTRH